MFNRWRQSVGFPAYWNTSVTRMHFYVSQEVVDESDGCGAKFVVLVVSNSFKGKPLLQRHRLVNSILEEELKEIHAFSQKTLTPEEWEKQKAQI